MPLRTIKAKAAKASELLATLKRKARALEPSGPVLVVYDQAEAAASIYYESEAPPGEPKPRRR